MARWHGGLPARPAAQRHLAAARARLKPAESILLRARLTRRDGLWVSDFLKTPKFLLCLHEATRRSAHNRQATSHHYPTGPTLRRPGDSSKREVPLRTGNEVTQSGGESGDASDRDDRAVGMGSTASGVVQLYQEDLAERASVGMAGCSRYRTQATARRDSVRWRPGGPVRQSAPTCGQRCAKQHPALLAAGPSRMMSSSDASH